MNSLQVRFAEPTDADEVASLFFGGFAPEVAQLLIYGCKGAPDHIRMQLSSGARNAESVYFVAQTADGIAGAAELRRRPDALFLNYIAVHPRCRGQRIGAVLFLQAVKMSGITSGQIELDVLDNNVRALQWYTRLGFSGKASTEFLELAPPAAASTAEDAGYVAGLPQAELCQQRFGFSKFALITRNGTFSVGRIGDEWFRLTDVAAACSPAVFAALRLLDPSRHILAVLPAASVPPARVVRLLAKTHRLGMEITRLVRSLSNDCQESRELV